VDLRWSEAIRQVAALDSGAAADEHGGGEHGLEESVLTATPGQADSQTATSAGSSNSLV